MAKERYRILIVDDDADLRTILRITFAEKFEVVEAVDGLDALNKLPDYQPDLAIVDYEMPLMGGLQLCEAIRRHSEFRGIPVLFLSAHGSKAEMKAGYEAGADLFMTKPIEPARVLRNVEFTIEHEKPPLRSKKHTLTVLQQMDEMRTSTPREPAAGRPVVLRAAPAPAAAPSAGDITTEERVQPQFRREAVSPPPPPPHPEEVKRRPVKPEPAPEAERPAARYSPAPASAGRARVMVVDNEEDARNLMEMALRDDFEVTTAHDGLDAIEKIVNYQPDLMLIDVMMPRMNGFHLLQSIRRNPAFKHLPVAIVTVRASQRDHDYAMRMGANEFIAKPFSPDEFLERVRGMTKLPGFRIAPKQLPIEEIIEREIIAAAERHEADGRHEEKQKYSALQDILNEEKRRLQDE